MAKHIKEIVIKVTDKGSLKVTTKEVDKLNAAVNRTNAASGKAAKGAQNLDRNMKGAAKMSSNASKNFSKQAQGMQGVLVPAYAEVAARVFALTAAYTALKNAADYSTLLKGQEAYAKMTGKHMGSIARDIQSASGYMLDFQQASESAALASTAGLTTKQIAAMTKGARAASVALGRDMADAMDRLTRGIVKAEPEILDELGIIIRLDTVYRKFAEDIGKTTTELTEFEKLTARTNAILGQTTDKFGDIAKTVPANGFLQLSAAVFDLAKAGGALLSDVLQPLTKWLAESPLLLGLLMAVITKNVLGKALPMLGKFGATFSDLPNKMASSMDKLKKKSDALAKKSAVFKDMLGKPKDMEKDLRNTLNKLNIKPNSALAGALGKSISGKEFRDAIKKSISAAVGGANAKITRTGAPGGMFGTDVGAVNILRDAFNKFDKSLKATNQSMRGLVGVEFLNFVNNAKKGFLHMSKGALGATQRFMDFNKELFEVASGTDTAAGSMIAAFKMIPAMVGSSVASIVRNFGAMKADMQSLKFGSMSMTKTVGRTFLNMGRIISTSVGASIKVISGLATIVMSKLIASLNYLTFAIGALSMLGMLGSWLLGLTDHLGKATKAADELGDSLSSVSDRIEAASHINFDLMASNLTDAIRNSEFVAAVSEEISRSLEKAMSQINIDLAMGEGPMFQLVDKAYDIFGMGLEDKLGDALGLAIKAMSDLKIDVPDSTFDKISKLFKEGQGSTSTYEQDNVLEKIRLGIKLTVSDLVILQEELENSDNAKGMADALGILTKAHTEHGKAAAESDANLKSLRETLQKYEKDRKSLVKGLVKGSIFQDLEKDFQGLVNLLQSKQSDSNKVLTLEKAGILPTDNGDVKSYMEKLEGLRTVEAALAKARENQTEDKSLIFVRDNLLASVDAAGKDLYAKLKGSGDEESLLAKLFGQNPKDANADAISLAGNIVKIQSSIQDYRKLGNVSLKKQGSLEAIILRLQREQLGTKLKFSKPGELTTEEYESITDQIEALTKKAHEAGRNFGKISEHTHDINDTVYTLSERLKNLKMDVLGAGFEADTWSQFDLEAMVDLNALQQITKEFNNLKNSLNETFSETQALEGVTDRLKLAVNKGLLDEKTSKKMLKAWRLMFTKEGKLIRSRNKSITEEYALIDATRDINDEETHLINLRETMTKWELNISDDILDNEKKRVKYREAMLTLAQVEAELFKAKQAENIGWLADAFAGIADSFAGAISSVVSDYLMKKENDNWQEDLTQGLADTVGDMVGGFAKTAVFGNDGLLAGVATKMFDAEQSTIDALFPRTQVELLTDQLSVLKDIAANTRAEVTGKTIEETKTELRAQGWRFRDNIANPVIDQIKAIQDSSSTSVISQDPAPVEAVKKAIDWIQKLKDDGYLVQDSIDNDEAKDIYFQLKDQSSALNKISDILATNRYNITPEQFIQASSAGPGIGATPIKELDFVAGQIDQGISPSVTKILKDIEQQVKQSQDFLGHTAAKTLEEIQWLVETEIGSPLMNAEVSLSGFMEFIDGKMGPLVDGLTTKLLPILDDLPGMIAEVTSLISGINKDIKDFKAPWDLNPFSSNGSLKGIEDALLSKVDLSQAAFTSSSVAMAGSTGGPDYKNERIWNNIRKDMKVQAEAAKKLRLDAIKNATKQGAEDRHFARAWWDKHIKPFFNKNGGGGSAGAHKKGPFSNKPPYTGTKKVVIHQESTGRSTKVPIKDQYRSGWKSGFNPGGAPDKDLLKRYDYLQEKGARNAIPGTSKVISQPVVSQLVPILSRLNALLLMLTPSELADGTLKGTGYNNDTSTNVFEQFNENGALKVLEQDPEAQKGSGVINVSNPNGDFTAEKVGSDLKQTLANNLHSQIMNDNVNAKSIIQGTVASVGSDLLSSGLTAIIGGIFGFANGGVLSGGFRAFASGGTVTKPTLGLVGEGKYNEAVVPLPDGKSIPVIGNTGGSTENNVTVNVTVDSNGNTNTETQGGSSKENAKQLGYMVSQAVQAELVVQQRPGGLLSQY